MVQRILEPGQIETLTHADIPRFIAPDPAEVFARRSARLLALADASPIAPYLRLMATLVDAQQVRLDEVRITDGQRLQDLVAARAPAARAAGMPPLDVAALARGGVWREGLRALCRACAGQADLPEALAAILARLGASPDADLDVEAAAVLDLPGAPAPDPATAPFVMAALQVEATALGLAFSSGTPGRIVPMPDAPGLCPICGSAPVTSIVRADAPFASYRYLACSLCTSQWHHVRVQCTHCGAAGPEVGYETLVDAAQTGSATIRESAVRAETCTRCHGYRKILYQEKDPAVEAVADDLGTLALDLLLGEQGFERLSGNPLLWQPGQG